MEILAIDIGGSKIKTAILNKNGKLLTDYKKLATPQPATPEHVIATIKELVTNLTSFDKISVGFPGYVKEGVIYTAPNLDHESWIDFDLEKALTDLFQKPTRVVNDADMQGLGVVSGKGFEMMITLGTGFGTAFLKDGKLLPHIELAHHPISKNKKYDEYLGEEAFKEIGDVKWNKRLKKVIAILKEVFNYDRLYLGGGNASEINFKLDDNIMIVTNKEGIDGGAALWK